MTGKKQKKDMKENASSTIVENKEDPILNGGRTVIIRDQSGEIVLSSTYELDTLGAMINIAHTQKLIQNNIPITKEIPGARSYYG